MQLKSDSFRYLCDLLFVRTVVIHDKAVTHLTHAIADIYSTNTSGFRTFHVTTQCKGLQCLRIAQEISLQHDAMFTWIFLEHTIC